MTSPLLLVFLWFVAPVSFVLLSLTASDDVNDVVLLQLLLEEHDDDVIMMSLMTS